MERGRERLNNGITNERTNSVTNIGKDERENGKTKNYTPLDIKGGGGGRRGGGGYNECRP